MTKMLQYKRLIPVPTIYLGDWDSTNYESFSQVKKTFKESYLHKEFVETKKYLFVFKKRELLIYCKEKQRATKNE